MGVADAAFHNHERARWKLDMDWRPFVRVSCPEAPDCGVPPFSSAAAAPRRHLRTCFAVMIVIAGSSVVAGNLALFAEFGRFYPGSVVAGGLVFVWGIVLCLRTILGD